MVSPSHLKSLHSLHLFSTKSSPSSSSTLSSMKMKTLIHTLVFSHLCRIVRALSKAKSILFEIIKEIQLIHFIQHPLKKNKNRKQKIFSSFRLHYNWCSSHVLPVPEPIIDKFSYYDPSWNSIISTDQCEDGGESQLSGYLHWLEEKVHEQNSSKETDINEIDKLADMFIANCHEKFRLEKQESYRRFQEMMARSM